MHVDATQKTQGKASFLRSQDLQACHPSLNKAHFFGENVTDTEG